MYCPEWILPNDLTVTALVYEVLLPTTGCEVLVAFLNPAGPVHTVVTMTGAFTNVLSSTAQVRMTLDPMGRIGLALL